MARTRCQSIAVPPIIQFLLNVLVPQVSVHAYVTGMLRRVQAQQLLGLWGLSTHGKNGFFGVIFRLLSVDVCGGLCMRASTYFVLI